MITIEHERTFIDLRSFPFRPPQSKPNMTEKIRISAEQSRAVQCSRTGAWLRQKRLRYQCSAVQSREVCELSRLINVNKSRESTQRAAAVHVHNSWPGFDSICLHLLTLLTICIRRISTVQYPIELCPNFTL